MAALEDGLRFELAAEVRVSSVDELLACLRHAFDGYTWPTVRGLASPPSTKPNAKLKPPPTDDINQLLERVDSVCKDPTNVELSFGHLSGVRWSQSLNRESFHLSVDFAPQANLFVDPAECIRAPTYLARRLLQRGVVVSAAVERFGDNRACVPLVPHAKTRRPLVAVTPADVEQFYERPDEFWSAGWTIEQFGEQRLLTRCQNAVTRGEVLRETQDFQWQMARAAKPKATKWGTPTVTDDEREIYEAGEPRLQPVGRNRTTGAVEYSCVLQPGEHIRGYEVFYLRSLVQNKQLDDGTPLTSVRVVFLEQWMAESEKRPLLDNGVEVFYDDPTTGEVVQITT